ncbi:unnamed protein product [Amoebophrya sp. A25]|nr:unnamed protein product [Amoebophrya sp. A25]|eukprot:GSA25T00009767001.1
MTGVVSTTILMGVVQQLLREYPLNRRRILLRMMQKGTPRK